MMNNIEARRFRGGPWINIYKQSDKEIYWSGATGYETKEIAQYGLCDEYHRIATINVKEVLNQQLEIEQLKQRIEFAKQAIDLFFKTEDESKLLEIAEWD